jgi:hypothetical protein
MMGEKKAIKLSDWKEVRGLMANFFSSAYLVMFNRLRLLISLYKEVCLILSKLRRVSTKAERYPCCFKTETI